MKRFFIIISLLWVLLLSNLYTDELIIISTVPKSGTAYIREKLSSGLNQLLLSEKNLLLGLNIHPEKLADLVKRTGTLVYHIFPTPQNIQLLKEYNVKIVFHIRDIRQQTLSWAHHQFYISNNPQKRIHKWIKERFKEIYPTKDYEKWRQKTLHDCIEEAINDLTDAADQFGNYGYIRMVQEWLQVYKEGTLPMLITTYEDLHDDEESFFLKILAFYNIPKDEFTDIAISKTNKTRFRKGSKDEWREVLTLEQQKRINDQIPEELFSFFGWER